MKHNGTPLLENESIKLCSQWRWRAMTGPSPRSQRFTDSSQQVFSEGPLGVRHYSRHWDLSIKTKQI